MDNNALKEDLISTRFHFHKIEFTPRKGVKESSNDILYKIITFLNQERTINNKVYLIDKHANRKDAIRRELFMYYSVPAPRTKRIKCALALIDDKKKPMIKPKHTFDLVPFDTASGSITELTTFFIDYSVSPAIMCVEFNNSGPRLSDIEFYFRNIAHEKLFLAKATSTTTIMDSGIDNMLENLYNVVNFEFKIKPQNLTNLDNDVKGYISGISSLENRLKPKFIKVEAMYQTPGAKIKSNHLNKEANTLARLFLNKFKTRPFHIDNFEDFELKYINKDGEDAVFNLIKGKKEIVLETKKDQHLTTTDWYELIENKFDEFMKGL